MSCGHYLRHVSLLVLSALCGMTSGHTMEDSRRLLADTRANYSRELRPLHNQSAVLEVSVGFDVMSIMDFDEVQEKITVTAVLYLMWKDEYFTWDPQDYNGLDYIITATTGVWIPHILLTNAAMEMDKLTEDWHLLHVGHDGTVIYFPGDIFSATCSIDVTYYPLDVQTCAFMFVPWGYPSEQLKLVPYQDKVYFTFFVDNGAWTVVDSFAGQANGEDIWVSFELKLERKPLFVLVNVILPLTFMSVLNVLIFLLPAESGERMSFCLTVLLAIAVFLTLVGDILPKTSSPMSLYSYYLLSVLVISLCITLCTIFSLNLYHREECEPITSFWRRLTICLKCQRKKRATPTSNSKRYIQNKDTAVVNTVTAPIYRNGEADNTTGFVNNTLGVPTAFNSRHYTGSNSPLWQNTNGIQRLNSRIANPSPKEHRTFTDVRHDVIKESHVESTEVELRWKDVSVAVDKIAFVIFVVVIVLDNLIFMAAISRGRN